MSSKQKSNRGNKKFYPKKGSAKPSTSTKLSTTEPPILKWGDDTNIREFTKQMLRFAVDRFGIMAHSIIEDLAEPTIPPVVYDEDELLNDDVLGLKRAEITQAIKSRRIKVEQMKEEKPKLYAYTHRYLSTESLDAVKNDHRYAGAERLKIRLLYGKPSRVHTRWVWLPKTRS